MEEKTRRAFSVFESHLEYTNDNTGIEGYLGKFRSDLPTNKSGSFNLVNRGELSTGEYVSYLGYLEDRRITERLLAEGINLKNFPKANPTPEQYADLIKIIDKLELDLGLDSELELNSD
jgi:hypothetical protein